MKYDTLNSEDRDSYKVYLKMAMKELLLKSKDSKMDTIRFINYLLEDGLIKVKSSSPFITIYTTTMSGIEWLGKKTL